MVRPRLDPYWTDFARGLFENEPELNDRQMAERCELEMAKTGRVGPPAQRTITKWRHEWKSSNHEERMVYRLFYWPESMVRGLLPWDASQAALEFLKAADHRPSITTALWFSRVTQAAPDAPIQDRVSFARYLTAAEMMSDFSAVRGLEGFLAFAPWRSAEDGTAYEQAIIDGKVPENTEKVTYSKEAGDRLGWHVLERALDVYMGLPDGWIHAHRGDSEESEGGTNGQEG